MLGAIFTRMYAAETKRVIRFRGESGPKKTIGKSYDMYESKRLKKRHVGNSYDVDEK